MKKILLGIGVIAFLLMGLGMANASLVTIGTATYFGSDFNLIWDDDNNGNSVIWLDYTHAAAFWDDQNAWAAGLAGQLTNINTPGWTISWDDSAWRLPSAGIKPQDGYYQTTSEMGHLYYDELGNPAGGPLSKTGDFEHLFGYWYWSGTEYVSYPDEAWFFDMNYGYQSHYDKFYGVNVYGLALRSGHVSAVSIPSAVWLLGSGLIGLAAVRRWRSCQ